MARNYWHTPVLLANMLIEITLPNFSRKPFATTKSLFRTSLPWILRMLYLMEDLAYQMECAFHLSESMRPGSQTNTPPPLQNAPTTFTTYHPLLVESYFSILICPTDAC